MKVGYTKIAILDEYLAIGSMTGGVRTQTATPAAWTTTMKRTEQNIILLYAAVNLKPK